MTEDVKKPWYEQVWAGSINIDCGHAFDCHEGASPLPPLRIGYSMPIPPAPVRPEPETVEVSGDEFDSFIMKHFPDFGREAYGPRPASDEPVHFIHPTKERNRWGEFDLENRIGVVRFLKGKPHKFFLRKDVYDSHTLNPSPAHPISAPRSQSYPQNRP